MNVQRTLISILRRGSDNAMYGTYKEPRKSDILQENKKSKQQKERKKRGHDMGHSERAPALNLHMVHYNWWTGSIAECIARNLSPIPSWKIYGILRIIICYILVVAHNGSWFVYTIQPDSVCVCFLPIHSGHQVRWTYQPGSHRRKVTQDF